MAPLVPGSLYEVTYKSQSGNYRWYRWRMTAVFLDHQTNQWQDECIFSLRPRAGSTALTSAHIEEVRLLRKNAGARDVTAREIHLPMQSKSSCSEPTHSGSEHLRFLEDWAQSGEAV